MSRLASRWEQHVGRRQYALLHGSFRAQARSVATDRRDCERPASPAIRNGRISRGEIATIVDETGHYLATEISDEAYEALLARAEAATRAAIETMEVDA